MKNENLENNIINNNLNNDSNEVQNLSNIIPNNNNDSIQNLSTSSSYKVIEDNNNTNDKNNNNNEKHIINNGIEIPLNPLSNSIKILKKDKHGEVLSNISYSYIFKVSLIGDSSTGVDFKLVSFELEPKIYAKMQIWDTCGSERFKSLTSSFIKTCSAFILIFDLTRKNTFHNIDHWIKIIKENTSPKFMILIGNKSDLINERNIDKEIILDYCEKNLFNYMEISAKNNLNIEKLFKEVAYQLYNDIKKSEKNDIKNIGYKGNFSDIQVKLDDNNPSQKKGCCW